MGNPYTQVAMTYARRMFTWRTIPALVLFGGLTVFAVVEREVGMMAPVLCMLPFWLGGLASHMTEQFAGWQAHLTPNFRRVHALVAAAVVLVVVVLVPALLTWLAGCCSVGIVAIAAFLFGGSLWLVTRTFDKPASGVLMVLWMLGGPAIMLVGLLVEPVKHELVRFVSGQLEPQAVALACLGVTLIVLGGIRLLRVDDDMLGAQYFVRGLNSWGWQNRGVSAWAGLPQPAEATRKAGLANRMQDRQIERLVGYVRSASISRWSAVCRWQMGGVPSGWSAWLLVVAVIFVIQLVTWWAITKGTRDATLSFLLPIFFWLFIMPAVILIAQCAQRARTAGYEILLPVGRSTYLRQLGVGIAMGQVQLWCAVGTATILWWVIAAQSRLPCIAFANILACSALAQVGLFGVGVWGVWLANRYSSHLAFLVFVMGVAAFSGAMSAVADVAGESLLAGLQHSPWLAAATGLFAVLGALLAWHAYRRWLVADLD